MFRRGEDRIPRHSVRLFYAMILLDERETLYQQTVRGIRRSSKFALHFLERAADRLEGKPKQHVIAETRRSTVFTLDTEGQPAVDAEPAEVVSTEPSRGPEEEVNLAALPLAAPSLVVLPPPG